MLDGPSLPDYMDRLRAELEKAPELWAPYQTIDDVMASVDEGDYQVWMGGKESEILVWGITQLRIHKRCRVLSIIWCSGREGPEFYERWMDALEVFAETMELDRITIEGRKGWERIFAPFGFRFTAVELVKDFPHGTKAAE